MFALVTFSATFTACDPEPEACEDVVFDDGTVSFNGETLKLVEGSSFQSLGGIQTVISVNFISNDCELQYSIALQLIGDLQSTYDLSTISAGTSSIIYTTREPLAVDSQGFKSGTLEIEDEGDGVYHIEIDGIDQADNEVNFEVEYDFE